ncbi:MAG: hypothetical protein AAF549_04880 [Pseudomonadota bacterium]
MGDLSEIVANAVKKPDISGAGKMSYPIRGGQYKGHKVVIEPNRELEFKIGLRYLHEVAPDTDQSTYKSGERHIMEKSDIIWRAYLKYRYGMEKDQGLSLDGVMFSDGSSLPSIHQEQNKERRVRDFYDSIEGIPDDLEIRTEIKDGKFILMVKKGNGASEDNPVIERQELKLTTSIGPSVREILGALPIKIKQELGIETKQIKGLFPGSQSQSMRTKSKIRGYASTKIGPLVVVFEPANDRGSGINLAGQPWPLREFEGEVKGIYKPGDDTDLKKHPEHAGLTEDDIREISNEFLIEEHKRYAEFVSDYLVKQAGDKPCHYGGLTLQSVFHSKSFPGRQSLRPILATQTRILKDAIRDVRENGFSVQPHLAHGQP